MYALYGCLLTGSAPAAGGGFIGVKAWNQRKWALAA